MDIYGNKKPVQIETDEWWYNGRIIQKQNHPMLPRYISFEDNEMKNMYAVPHHTKKDAVNYCQHHPCKDPTYFPHNYL